MAHNRKLLLGGTSLTMAKPNKFGLQVMEEIRDELEEVLIASKYFDNSPFKYAHLSLRYGLKNDDIPIYLKGEEKYNALALAIELDVHELLEASRGELKKIFSEAILKSLVHAGKKYNLPSSGDTILNYL